MKIDFNEQDLYFPVEAGKNGEYIIRRKSGTWEGVTVENFEQVKIVLENLFIRWNSLNKEKEIPLEEGELNIS